MTKSNIFNSKAVVAAGAVLTAGAATATVNLAGDATFQTAVDTITAWTQGTLGTLISLAIVIVGISVGIVRQSIMGVVVGVGAALALMNAPDIIDGMFAATL